VVITRVTLACAKKMQKKTHAATLRSLPVTLATPLECCAEIAEVLPLASSVTEMSSLSMSSRVDLVSSSTSAVVRPLVGMGSKTWIG
jgi:hypothetical protein